MGAVRNEHHPHLNGLINMDGEVWCSMWIGCNFISVFHTQRSLLAFVGLDLPLKLVLRHGKPTVFWVTCFQAHRARPLQQCSVWNSGHFPGIRRYTVYMTILIPSLPTWRVCCVCVCNLLYIQAWVHTHLPGEGGEGGEPCPTPSPGKRTCMLANGSSRIVAWGASSHFHGHLIFVLCHSRCLAQQGQDPHPYASSSFCFAGMPFPVSGVPLEPNYHSPSLLSLSG